MDLETRIANLENLVESLVIMMSDNKVYTDADVSGLRYIDDSHDADIKDNSDAIFDVADTIELLDERVTALEEARNG